MKGLQSILVLAFLSTLVACNDNSTNQPVIEASLLKKPAGSYQGSLATEDGEVVMVRAIYDGNGTMFYAYYPDNSDKAHYVATADRQGRGAITGTGKTLGSLTLNNLITPSGDLNSIAGINLTFLHQGKVLSASINSLGKISGRNGSCLIEGQLNKGETPSSYQLDLRSSGCGLPEKMSGIAEQNTADAPALLRIIAVGENQLVDWLLYDA